ncbi:unnamed protein product [Euphydryas editha]|uniref:Uncharacterized protein n=1 Tax=Euphydryas editha TaxID=104508 RepID=A0AAU9V725_EUPED|nr:unnamed protein product [Euphydryas editha]
MLRYGKLIPEDVQVSVRYLFKDIRSASAKTHPELLSNQHTYSLLPELPSNLRVKSLNTLDYGHVTRRSDDYVGRNFLDISVSGARHSWCPRKQLLDVVKQDMSANGLTIVGDKDHVKWRKLSRKADPCNSRD